MPIPAYIKITGAMQGEMTKGALSSDSVGTFAQASHEDEILVQAIGLHVAKPVDSQSGQVTGVRQHKPVVFTKIMDKSSPLLWQALCSCEQLTIECTYFRTSQAGKQEKYFTVKWSEALLVDGKAYYPLAISPDNAAIPHIEDWSFSYKKIEWTHQIAGTSAGDDWNNA